MSAETLARRVLAPTFDVISRVNDSRKLKTGLFLFVLAVVVTLPFGVSGFRLHVMTWVLVAIIMANGYNVIGGLAGYPSFGHAVFFGIGAYTTGIAMNTYGLPFLPTVLLGAVVAALVALLTGPPLLRIRGHYFAIATIGLQIAVERLIEGVQFFGGGSGWPTVVSYSQYELYLLFVGLAIVSVGMVWAIRRSRFGYGLRALALNEEQAEMVGVPTGYYKTSAYVLSVIPVGLAGGLFAGWINFINLSTVFAIEISINMILYVILGGVGTLAGPIVGAVVLETSNQYLWSSLPNLHVMVYGLFMVLIVLYLPGGLMGAYEDLRDRYS